MLCRILSTIIFCFIFFILTAQHVFASTIKINEFVAHPGSDQKEWVEFYKSVTGLELDVLSEMNEEGISEEDYLEDAQFVLPPDEV